MDPAEKYRPTTLSEVRGSDTARDVPGPLGQALNTEYDV